MIPLLQVLLCCNVDQERFFKRLVANANKPYSLQESGPYGIVLLLAYLHIYHNRGIV